MEKTVNLFIPKLSGDTDPNVVVSINNDNYVLPKGKVSVVSEAVAYEYERSLRARAYCDENVERIMASLKSQAKTSEQQAREK